jgi:chromosome segregation ATPase
MTKPTNKDNRAAVAAELEAAQAALADAQARLEKAAWSPVVHNPEASRLVDLISASSVKVQGLQDRLALIDKVAAYHASVEAAPAEAEEFSQAAAEAERRAAELEARAAAIRARIEALRAAVSGEEERTAATQADAARAFAKAIGTADERAALSRVHDAQKSALTARLKAESEAAVVSALTTEAEALDQQAAAEREAAKERRQAMNAARRLTFGAQWDATAQELANIGRKLLEAGESRLHDLRIPTFSPESSGSIRERDLIEPPAVDEPPAEGETVDVVQQKQAPDIPTEQPRVDRVGHSEYLQKRAARAKLKNDLAKESTPVYY